MRVIGRGIAQSGMCFKNEINETEDSGNSLEPTIHSPRGLPMLCVQEPVIKEAAFINRRKRVILLFFLSQTS